MQVSRTHRSPKAELMMNNQLYLTSDPFILGHCLSKSCVECDISLITLHLLYGMLELSFAFVWHSIGVDDRTR